MGIQRDKIFISENYINVPGLFKNYFFDEYNEAAVIIQNQKGEYYGIDRYNGSNFYQIDNSGADKANVEELMFIPDVRNEKKG